MKQLPDDRVTVRLGPDLYAQLQSFAWQHGNGHQLDISGILREALRRYLKTPSRQTEKSVRQSVRQKAKQ